MEATQKQKGSVKSKLAKSFGLGTNRTSQPHCSSKVKPSPSSPPLMNQNGSNHSSLKRMSYASSRPAATATLSHPNRYVNAASKGYMNTAWGGYGGDENVDVKAESYISHVRERFKREGVDSTNATWGGYGVDENVDVKAKSYISHVRERFKMEGGWLFKF